jgi:Ca-activated chloride channel family protein
MFRHPLYLLWMLPALGAAAALFLWAAKRRRALSAALGREETLRRLIPPEAAARRWAKAWLRLAGLALLFIALAGPQWGVERVSTQSVARNVILAVDVSASMAAEDVKPNRLEKAKTELALLLDGLKGERVGILAFAGRAEMLCPITHDIEAAKQVLRALEVGAVPEPGTAVGSALREATAQLARYPGGRAVVLLTDGEDHRTDPLGAAEEAAKAGIRVLAVGIGSPEGVPLPLRDPGTNEVTGYKKDLSGGTVISRLGEKALAAVAARTGGAYYRATPGEEESSEILKAVAGLAAAEGLASSSNRYKNRFAYPLAAALVLLLAELLLPALPARGQRPLAAAGLLILLTSAAQAAGSESALRRGNRLYQKEDYHGALESYLKAAKPGDPRPVFNAGDTLYRLEDYGAAAESFQALTSSAAPRDVRAAAGYNLGNSLMRQDKAAEAVDALRAAVTLDPSDAEARHNLALALKALRQPPKKQKNDGKKDKDKQDQKDSKEPAPKTQNPQARPEDRLSREDAERILRAVKEKEKAPPATRAGKAGSEKPQNREDW